MKICEFCKTQNNDINSFCTNCKQPFNDIKQKNNTEDLNKIPKIIKVLFIFILVMLSLGLLQIQKNKIKQQVRDYFKQQLIQEVNTDTNKEKLLSDDTDYKINEHNTITAQPIKKYDFDGVVLPDNGYNESENKTIQKQKTLYSKINQFFKQNKENIIGFSILSIILILFITIMIKTSAYKIFVSLTLLKTFLKQHKNLLILTSSSLLFLFLSIASDGNFSAGFYTLLRITVTVTSCYIIYLEFIKKNIFFYLFIATSVLFNPIIQLHFHRDTWQTIDILTILLLIIYLKYVIIKFVKTDNPVLENKILE